MSKSKRGFTLRAALLVTGACAALYVAAVFVIIALRVAPTATRLQTHTEKLRAEFAVIHERIVELDAAIIEAEQLLRREIDQADFRSPTVRGGADEATRSLRAKVQSQLDRAVSVHTAAGLSDIPFDMRMALAETAVSEGQLGAALMESLSYIELQRYKDARTRLDQVDSLNRVITERLRTVQRLSLIDLIERQGSLGEASRFSMRALMWWSVGGGALLFVIALFFYRRLYRPLAELDEGLGRVAGGDLAAHVEVRREDEIGRLGAHFNEMTQVLRRRAEEEKRRALNLTERFGRVLDESGNEIYIFDAEELRFVQVNRGARENLGYSQEELARLTPRDLLPEYDEDSFADLIRPLRTGDRARVVVSTMHLRQDGSLYPVEVNLQMSKLEKPPVFVAIIQDITERKRAEQALRESRQKYETLVDSINGIVWEGDPQTFGFSFVSHRAEEILGYRVERWLAEPGFWSDHIHPDDREWALDYCTKASAKNSAHQFEYRMLAADGRVVWLRDIVTIVVEEDGSKKARGVMIDITEHKRAEEALRASEERFSKAFHASPLPMSIGRDLHFIDVNDTLLLGSGYTRDEIIGRSAIELGMLPDLDEVHKMRQLIDEQGAVRNLEMNLRMKNGELRLHLISAEPIELGGEQCLLMVGDDITERKRAEEEQARLQAGLRESAREWRLTFDTVESLIMILDLEGRVKRLNRCAKEISGRDYTESLRGSVALMAEGQPWQKIAELARSVARTRRATSAQVKDDSTGRTWDIALSLFAGPEVEEERIIVVARDITAMVELQESLRRSETLYAMGKLVAGVAHEVRNPLFGISATLDAFDLRFGDQQEYSRYTDTLRGEANRLSQLMQELLDYGKPVTLELAESSIESVMTEAIKVCAPLAEKAKVRLVEKCGGEFTPVLMDRKRMAQVFRNLIENAIQHSTEGARVEIEAKEVLEGGRKWVECAVKDSGPGFDEESIQRIFDPFFTKRKGGTGLGLSIVQRIVEEHSGRVEAGNRPEGGAQVLVRFPRARL